jgi:AraC family transcriptional regulator
VSTSVRLGHGEFYGAFERRAAVGPFVLTTLAARPHVDRHTHSEAHFILVLQGAYVSSAHSAGEVCGRATLIYNPPGTTHCDRFLNSEGRFFGLSIPAGELRALGDGCKFAETPHRMPHPRALALASAAATDLIDDDDTALEALSLELLGGVAQHQDKTGRTPPAWLYRACELIADTAEERHSVSTIAKALGVHAVHLARVFRAHVGMSPGEYARRRRLEQATDRLLHTDQRLADIAADLGYADQSHLTREFARASGRTPAQFRAALA